MSQVRLSFQAVQVQSTGAPPSEDGLPASGDSSTSSRGCAGCPLWASALQTPAQVHFTCMFPEIVQVTPALTLTPFMATTWSCPCLLWSRHPCLDKTFLVHRFICGAELCPVSLPTQRCPHKRHLGTKTMVFKAVQQELSTRVQCSVST